MGCLVKRWSTGAVCAALWLSPAGALAQSADDGSRAAARSLGTEGVEAFQRNDFQSASEKLEKAYRVLHVPSIGLWSARSLVKVGQLVKASERYREVTQLEITAGQVKIQKQAQEDAASELSALTPRLPSVVIQVTGAGSDVVVTVDGARVSADLLGERRPVDPGLHVIEGTRGDQHAKAEVKLVEGESKNVTLRFLAAPAAAPVTHLGSAATPPVAPASADEAAPSDTHSSLGTQRTLALVAGGVGVAGVVVGTVFGLKAKSKNDQSKAFCDGASCTDQRGVPLREDALKAGDLSTVAFAVGALGLAGGAVLWFTAHPEAQPTQVGLGFGTVEVRGQW